MIKLLALDLDGTLLNDQKTISPENKEAILQAVAMGVKLVLCTGRILAGTKPYFEQLNLNTNNEYLILNNGCAIHQTSDWSLVDFHALSVDDINYLSTFAKGAELPLTFCNVDHYYVVEQEANADIIQDTTNIFLTPQTVSLSELKNVPQPFFLAKFVGQTDLVHGFMETYNPTLSQRFSTVLSQPNILEMLPEGVSKATALQALSEKLGFTPDEVMAVGDANNDLEMLGFAGVAVAMGNAPDHVKALATDITSSNNDHGVAKAIQKWILNH